MNSNYNSAGFHMKGPSVAVEPMMGPLNESPIQGLNFVSNRDQYGFQTHGHGDMLAMGVQPQHQLHMQGPFNHQPPNHDQHSHLYQDSVPSCLHGDRHMGFNNSNTGHPHMFEGGFGQQLAEVQSRECISQQQQQQRMATMPEFQPHGHPNGTHAVPAPCLPLDQSPNRAASFHGLPSSSPETHRLEHYRLFPQGRMGGSEHCFPCDPLTGNFDMTGFSTADSSEHKLPYCETGNQVVGGHFATCNRSGSRGPMMGGSKVDQQLPQQNVFSDRFGNRGKMEPGVNARHHLMPQQRPGPVARQNPSSPALPRFYHTPDYVANNTDVQGGGPMVHVQHSHLDRPIHRLNSHNMHPFGEPVFDVPQLAPQPPHHPHLSSLPYLNMAKRPRFDLPNGSAGESCSPLSNSLHNRPNLENHLSPSAFPSPMGDFTSHVTDGFPSGPLPLSSGPQQQQQQRHVFGQSCLAALSTACQNMIASLGAPNLNVTFNKKSQNEAKRKAGQVEQDINSSGSSGPGAEYFQGNASQNSQTPCSGNNNNTMAGQSGTGQMAKREASTLSPNDNMESGCEGKMATGNGKGRGKKRRDSGHISPGNFSPPCGGNPVVSPSQQGSALNVGMEGRGKTPERSLVSPSFGKPDLTTSMDSGIQSVGKSDGVSPCMDYLDEASPNYSTEDQRPCRAGMKCNSENRAGYNDNPCMEQVRTPLSNTGQDEVHPLEILQAQIQLQRQQFSISEDQPMGGKTGKKADCQAGLNGECALASSSPVTGKGSVNTIDLDSLMTEQHATWYVPGNKALIEDPSNDKCLGYWDRARGQSDNKEAHFKTLSLELTENRMQNNN
uniref:Meningioma 1a n=1 Tax=Cyprinus carpio TaxID=7962 RepID=A0A8C1TGZ4_CYPCA